jgi:hypothetical protein
MNPFFDWVASASRFIDFDVPTAADLNAPLDEVTTGFDAVDAAIDAIDADLAGLTSPVQDQLDAKADITGETYSGTHDFSGATAVSVPAPSSGAHAVTKTYADGLSFSSALPGQGGNSGKFVTTDGSTASWAAAVNSINGATGAITGIDKMTYAARATNTVFAAADSTKFIEYTGSFTQTFGSAASLGAGWWIVLKNAYTDSVYLTPSGGATIDGVADFLMYPGEARLLQCDGTNFHSVVLQPFLATYTASGFFFKPPGYSYFGGVAWSAGCSGQRTNNTAAASAGGAGGGCGEFKIPAASFGTSETITIGAGGAAVTGVAAGNVGGNTTLGSLFTVYGSAASDRGGAIGVSVALIAQTPDGFAGGANAGSNAYSTIYGGATASADASEVSGSSVWGGAGGGGVNAAGTLRAAGTSKFGGSGGAASIAGNGTAGSVPGGGGGATQTGTASGAGGAGKLIIWGLV